VRQRLRARHPGSIGVSVVTAAELRHGAERSARPAESHVVIDAFLAGHKNFRLENLRSTFPDSWQPLIDPKGFLRTYPQMIIPKESYRLDGFFAARMKKH